MGVVYRKIGLANILEWKTTPVEHYETSKESSGKKNPVKMYKDILSGHFII